MTGKAVRRVPRAFERMAEGIAALHQQQADYPVSARCVLQRHNFRDLPNIVAAAHDAGLSTRVLHVCRRIVDGLQSSYPVG